MPHSHLGDPVPGWRTRPRPVGTVLKGATVRAEPLESRAHAAALFAAAHAATPDPHLWDYLPYGPFADEDEFLRWLDPLAAGDDPLFFVLVDAKTRDPFGMASFLRGEPAHGSIEIGHIWIGGSHQRSRQATEALYLLMRHALDDLGYRRLEWICDSLNQRSRRAAERLGFTFEGVFRQHRVVKGRNRDTAWFSIVDTEWPAIRDGFERWLADDNFDSEGVQRESLGAARRAVAPPTGG